jgi:hypothetical protein
MHIVAGTICWRAHAVIDVNDEKMIGKTVTDALGSESQSSEQSSNPRGLFP